MNKKRKPHFKYYWLDSNANPVAEAIYGVPHQDGEIDLNANHVLAMGLNLPKAPTLKTWIEQTDAKKRCSRCYAALRGTLGDWEFHFLSQHPYAKVG